MDSLERRKRIRAYLGIEPISHGQVYTFQIAIPNPNLQNIPIERRQTIEDSLMLHKTNLIPILVRRTEAYTEEEEYEVVYGDDWCIVAKQLDIEKLWVWVFDMTDEQAATAKEEMQQLLGSSELVEQDQNKESDLASLFEQKMKPIYSQLNQLSQFQRNAEKLDFNKRFDDIDNQIKKISSAFEALIQQIKDIIPPPKLNLITAKETEINAALEELGISSKQINPTLEAIKYWKQEGRVLNWQNLKKSAGSKEHSIKGFGKAAYQKLKEMAEIRSINNDAK